MRQETPCRGAFLEADRGAGAIACTAQPASRLAVYRYGSYNVGAHMKTTVEIADGLFEAARRLAERERTTLRALIEDGLRRVIASRREAREFRLRRCSFKGKGLSPDLAGRGWEAVRARAYDEHGG